ncbi:MAG: hypothetical protein ACO1SV_14555 [Fimbriimonas sp.]
MAILQRHRKPEVEPFVPSSVEFPRAVPVQVSVTNGSAPRGKSNGWLFVEDGRLVFRGEWFDFALRPQDFERPDGPLRSLSTEGVKVKVPKGISPQLLRIAFLARHGEEWGPDRTGQERFRTELKAWLARDAQGGSTFPPLRWNRQVIRMGPLVLAFGVLGVGLGVVTSQLPTILGTDILADRNMLGVGLAVAAYMFSMPLLFLSSSHGRKRFDHEVDKAQTRERENLTSPSE